MIHVYQIPKHRSNGYCFGGPVPIPFGNVDWMGEPPEEMSRAHLESFLRGKKYFTSAAAGVEFLVLAKGRPDLTFTMVKS